MKKKRNRFHLPLALVNRNDSCKAGIPKFETKLSLLKKIFLASVATQSHYNAISQTKDQMLRKHNLKDEAWYYFG